MGTYNSLATINNLIVLREDRRNAAEPLGLDLVVHLECAA